MFKKIIKNIFVIYIFSLEYINCLKIYKKGNQNATLMGSFSGMKNITSNHTDMYIICILKQEKVIFDVNCISDNEKCNKCESNNNLKLCVNEKSCNIFDSNNKIFIRWNFKLNKTKCGYNCYRYYEFWEKNVEI